MSVSNVQACGEIELLLFKRRRASGDTELEIAPFLLLRDIAPLGKAGVRRKNPIRAHPDDNLAAHRKFDTQRAVMGQTMGQESKLAKISIFFRYLMEFRGGQGVRLSAVFIDVKGILALKKLVKSPLSKWRLC